MWLPLAYAAFYLLGITLNFFPHHYVNAAMSNQWEATTFCKCICFGSNYSISHLTTPDNPAQPCLSCTKQWCLNQNLPICAGATLGDPNPDTATGKEGDVEARCFQRDSPRDQLIVSVYILLIFALLLGAGVSSRMIKAGIDPNVPWQSSKRWWEQWMPNFRRMEQLGFTRLGGTQQDEQDVALRDYLPVAHSPRPRDGFS
ncbi:hypothetical protein DL96DRAFT_1575392 [Flagelloscypha sp. PMI_526]|nr:hypothetical protein DL96DRAFT_1575392 [Flagelloscypha sp. PMI_526]